MTQEIRGLAAVGAQTPAPRETARATVDLDAICHNVEVLGEHAGSAAVMAVVKADGYGHGLLPCARAALSGGASWLGVAQLSEAMALRAAGIHVPILSWLHVPGSDFNAAIGADVDLHAPMGPRERVVSVDEVELSSIFAFSAASFRR